MAVSNSEDAPDTVKPLRVIGNVPNPRRDLPEPLKPSFDGRPAG
jgi:hypothetical protein